MSNISRQIDLVLNNDTVTLKEKLFLYRNDFGIEFRFNIKENKYLFDNKTYISDFENCKASVTFVKPSGEAFYINTAIVEEGLLVFQFNADMCDEVSELGLYKIQFHLFNSDKSCRVTIPAFEIEVKDLIGSDPAKQPLVGQAEVGIAKLVATQENSITLFTIEDGYIKNYWENGDIITKEKLNNIEEGLEYLFNKIEEISYKAIVINSFNLSKTQAELGETITNLTMSWSYNKNPTTQSIDSSLIDNSLRSFTYTSPITSNKTFRLDVSDGKTNVYKNASINFYNCKYYGVSSSIVYDNSLILSLTKTIAGSRTGSWTVNANSGQYIYFAIPSRYGQAAFLCNGFEGGFFKANTIQFTNANGYIESYDIYRSDNHSLGDTTVTVK